MLLWCLRTSLVVWNHSQKIRTSLPVAIYANSIKERSLTFILEITGFCFFASGSSYLCLFCQTYALHLENAFSFLFFVFFSMEGITVLSYSCRWCNCYWDFDCKMVLGFKGCALWPWSCINSQSCKVIWVVSLLLI